VVSAQGCNCNESEVIPVDGGSGIGNRGAIPLINFPAHAAEGPPYPPCPAGAKGEVVAADQLETQAFAALRAGNFDRATICSVRRPSCRPIPRS